MKKYRKNSKGITLIVLVVTIIILLILAGISISGLFGTNGLITKAKEAALAQKKAQYFEEINLEILDEQTERFGQAKEEAFIKSLQTRIQNKKWVSGVLMCDDNFEEKEKIEENTILIIDTKDGYEIIVEVNNSGLTAQIRENYFEKIGKKCEVKYNNNGGNGKVESQEIRKGFSVILQESTLTKDGYEFVGWSEDKEGTREIYAGGSKLKIEEDTTLYAIWEKDTVTITFEANGGTGEMSPITVTKGKETKLPENTFQKEGYSFVKWNTNQDGTGTEYTNGANITINEDTILYAQWEIKVTATINFNQDKLTEGTKITIGGTALSSGIQKVELKIGTQTVYSEELQNTTTYTKELGIEDLNNIINLSFNDNYTATLGITSINNNKQEISKENIKNYTIGIATNLNKLAIAVNSGTTFEGETICQIADITTTENYIPIGYYDGTDSSDWTAIGPYFAGNYEGNNHKITLTSVTTDTKFKSSGIFGLVVDANISNLTVEGTNSSSVSHVGGIAGGIKNGKISNCINNCKITDTTGFKHGGIAGTVNQSTIENCINNKAVYGNTSIGGIVGYSQNQSKITNCSNSGSVCCYGTEKMLWGSNTGYYYGLVGGIVGNSEYCQISNCENSGYIHGNSKNMENHGIAAGGIVGWAKNSYISLSRSKGGSIYYNPNQLTDDGGALGGIAGALMSSTINQCFNTSNVSSKFITGEYMQNNSGGIVGYGSAATIKNVYNTSIIGGHSNVGGICGAIDNSVGQNYLYNAFNASGNIDGVANVGNVLGSASSVTGEYLFYIDGEEPIGTSTSNSFSNCAKYTLNTMSTTDTLLNQLNKGNGIGMWSRNNGFPYLTNNPE